MYQLVFAAAVLKILQKVYRSDRVLYQRLMTAIESLRTEPFQGKRLKGQFAGDFSLRVGDYRIIYTVRQRVLTVYIIDLGHRREIYQ